jgi:hypothetical protein
MGWGWFREEEGGKCYGEKKKRSKGATVPVSALLPDSHSVGCNQEVIWEPVSRLRNNRVPIGPSIHPSIPTRRAIAMKPKGSLPGRLLYSLLIMLNRRHHVTHRHHRSHPSILPSSYRHVHQHAIYIHEWEIATLNMKLDLVNHQQRQQDNHTHNPFLKKTWSFFAFSGILLNILYSIGVIGRRRQAGRYMSMRLTMWRCIYITPIIGLLNNRAKKGLTMKASRKYVSKN